MDDSPLLAATIASITLAVCGASVAAWTKLRSREVPSSRALLEISIALSALSFGAASYVASRGRCCDATAGVAAIAGICAASVACIAAHRSKRRVPVTVAIFALAAALPSAYWSLMTMPARAISDSLAAAAITLDFIPAALSLMLPVAARSGLHHFFHGTTYCFPGPPLLEAIRYYRTAVAAYLLLFHIPAGVRAFSSRRAA